MKRAISLLLILGLLNSASLAHAQTVREQVDAPERIVIPAFQTATGLSTFTIDAQVQVPDTDSLNVYAYNTVLVTEELLRNIADAIGLADMVIAPFEEIPHDQRSVPYPLTRSSSELNQKFLSGSNDIYSAQCCEGWIEFDDRALLVKEDITPTSSMFWPCEGETAPDTDYPFADATKLALEAVQKIAPDMTLVTSGVLASYKQLTDAEIRKLNDKNYKGEKPDTLRYGAYGYVFARVVEGVAVTYDESTAFCGVDPDDEAYIYPVVYERLALAVKDGQVVRLIYSAPASIGERVKEKVDLLPFEQVLTIAQAILPLKYAGWEVYLDNGRTISYPIDSIVLGYMRVRVSGNPNAFELIPVWDFFGQRIYDPVGNSGWKRSGCLFRESLLTINAMDGTVIDREYGY